MARVVSVSNDKAVVIGKEWMLASTAPDAIAHPRELQRIVDWLPAKVPGTVANTLAQAGCWNRDSSAPLHDRDYWYRAQFTDTGRQTLIFAGLATLAEVWLNGEIILRSDNMFLAHEIDVSLQGTNELCICFRALDALLRRPVKRPRWRPAMIVPATLRAVRTTLLGHMPGWCPPVHLIGPWRGIERVHRVASWKLERAQVHAELKSSDKGVLRVELKLSGDTDGLTGILECAGTRSPLHLDNEGVMRAELTSDSIEPWWPCTHGHPQLYSVRATVNGIVIDLGQVGFRRIELDRDEDGHGFALKINGVRIFCRGACWTTADLVGMTDTRETYEPWLRQMCKANMNMVRVSGTTVYEGDAFYQLCDELGLLVWQDFMFANFDYPVSDKAFEASVRAETAQFLDRVQASPCIAVLCGGSEVAQQAAMLGLPKDAWTGKLFGTWLPEICSALRPDVPYVVNSPYGGDLPFLANSGVTHYYGVGAYLRPLEDARRAEVRFASECLAFANVPESSTLEAALPVPAVHHPLWKQRTPRDQGASWDFEDVRDHYVELLYETDPALLRRTDPERYLALARACTGEVMEQVFAEWRRQRSTCSGGLVWTLQDLWVGAGWGVIDSTGEPKAAWYALRRAFRPIQVSLTDEGVNGLAIHVLNETPCAQEFHLSLRCLRGVAEVARAVRPVIIGARSAMELSSAELFGKFFDINYSYRFGPPAHEVTVAELADAATEASIAEAFHFPCGYDLRPLQMNWHLRAECIAEQWYLHLRVDHFAVSVHIKDELFLPEDNWFHLPPGKERCVRLTPRKMDALAPTGEVDALNSSQPGRYRGTA